jgi:hypothetical protein
MNNTDDFFFISMCKQKHWKTVKKSRMNAYDKNYNFSSGHRLCILDSVNSKNDIKT